MSDNYYFTSITQFVERIRKDYSDVNKAMLYFEGSECFQNKFEKTCAKIVFIALSIKDKLTFITHKQILDMYDGQQLVIAFNQNNKRKIEEKDKDCMFNLTINFEPNNFNGNIYYNSCLKIVVNTKNIAKIRSQITVYEVIENDIPDDAF